MLDERRIGGSMDTTTDDRRAAGERRFHELASRFEADAFALLRSYAADIPEPVDPQAVRWLMAYALVTLTGKVLSVIVDQDRGFDRSRALDHLDRLRAFVATSGQQAH
jgi:hypothetical protein